MHRSVAWTLLFTEGFLTLLLAEGFWVAIGHDCVHLPSCDVSLLAVRIYMFQYNADVVRVHLWATQTLTVELEVSDYCVAAVPRSRVAFVVTSH